MIKPSNPMLTRDESNRQLAEKSKRHAFGFKARFHSAIANGSKRCTIREVRRRMPVVGEYAVFYLGMRTKNILCFGSAEIIRVTRLSIYDGVVIEDGRAWSDEEMHDLAVRDGFKSAVEMHDFLRTALPQAARDSVAHLPADHSARYDFDPQGGEFFLTEWKCPERGNILRRKAECFVCAHLRPDYSPELAPPREKLMRCELNSTGEDPDCGAYTINPKGRWYICKECHVELHMSDILDDTA